MKIGENNRVRAPKSPDMQLYSTPIHLFRPCVQHRQIWRAAPKVQGQMDAVGAMRCYPPSISGATSSSPGDRRSWKETTERASSIPHPTSNIQHPAASTDDPMASMQISVGKGATWQPLAGQPLRSNVR